MTTAAFYIGVSIFLAYLIFILKKIGIKKLPSLSHSYYELGKQGWIFQLTLFSMVFLLMPQLLELTPESFQFVAFLTAAPLMFVGVAANFMDGGMAKKVHYTAAYTSAGLSLLLVILLAIFVNWAVILTVPISAAIFYLLFSKYVQITFFMEMAAFSWLIGSATILIQILKLNV
jgi:hypothetical protein